MSSRIDRSTSARIRDAAVEYVGEHGWEKATSRQIAAAAVVPVGLVNDHFGSKAGLRQACDDWVVEAILSHKSILLSASSPLGRVDSFLGEHQGPRVGSVGEHHIFSQPLIVAQRLRESFGAMTTPATSVTGDVRKENQ